MLQRASGCITGYIERMRTLLLATKNQEVSMRHRLNIYWFSMLAVLIAALLLVLSITGVLSDSRRKLGNNLEVHQQTSAYDLSKHIDSLTAKGIVLSDQLTDELMDFLSDEYISFEELNDSPELIAALENRMYTALYTALQTSECSGVYFILDATANTELENAADSRSGLYLRYADMSGINSSNKHIVLFRGSPQVAREADIELHNRWNLEFDTARFDAFASVMSSKAERLADSCVWTERLQLMDTWEGVMLLCVPVADSSGKVRGVCGVEISDLYFRLAYASSESAFGSTLTLLTQIEGSEIDLANAMIGRSEDVYLSADGVMTVRKGKYFNTYTIGQDNYLGVHEELSAGSRGGVPLSVLTLLPEGSYNRAASANRTAWIVGFLVFLLIALAVTLFFSKRFVEPIANTLGSIYQDPDPGEQRSGIREIDRLMTFARQRARVQSSGELPPDIENLFASFTERVGTLTATERTVLQYYIEGLDMNQIAETAFISINTVKKHNTNINRKLEISSREELLLYIDLYRRCGRLGEISHTAESE